MNIARACATGRAANKLLELGLLLVTPLVFYRGFAEQFSTIKVVMTEAIVIAAASLLATSLLWRWVPWPNEFPLGAPLGLLIASVSISCLTSPLPKFSAIEAQYFLCGPLWLAILAARGGGEAKVRWLASLVTIAATAMAAIALLQWSGYDPLVGGGYHVDWGRMRDAMRVYSTMGNPNFVAGYLIGAVFLALGCATTSKTLAGKLASTISSILIFSAIIGTRSRGAWLALIAGLLAARMVGRDSPQGQKSVEPSKLSAYAILPMALALLPSVARLAQVLASRFEGRMFLSRAAWPMFQEHPLFGGGWGMFQLRFPELQAQHLASHPDLLRYWTYTSQLHNDPLQVLLEAGALGFVAFVWLLVRYACGVRRAACGDASRPWLAASVGGVAAILVDSLFNFQFAIPPTLILLFTLMSFAALLRQSSTEPEASSIARRGFSIIASLGILAIATAMLLGIWNRAAAERALARGMEQESKGDFAQAEKLFREGVTRGPDDGRLHYGLARALFVQGRNPEALAEVLRAEPTVADAHLEVLHARILDQMGAASLALEAYRHALWLNPALRSVPADIRRLQSGAAASTLE